MSAPTLPAPASLDAATLLARALDAAHNRSIELFDRLATLSAMAEAETVEIKGDALRWLGDKFPADANDILPDPDHAQFAGGGGVYSGGGARLGKPDDDPRFRDVLRHGPSEIGCRTLCWRWGCSACEGRRRGRPYRLAGELPR